MNGTRATVLVAAVSIAVAGASTAMAMSFDEDLLNGSVLVSRSDGTLNWLKRNGNSLTGQATFNANGQNAIDVGDWDGDVNGDVLIARGNGFSLLTVERNGGGLSSPMNFNLGPLTRDVVIGNIDNDGSADAIVARDSGGITWMENTGTNSMSARQTFNLGSAVRAVDIGDIDGDARPDIIASQASNSLNWIEFNGVSSIGGQASTTVSNIAAMAVADIDSLAFDDIVSGRTDSLVTWSRKGGGTSLTGVTTLNVGSPVVDLAVGDADGDATLDIFLALGNGTIRWIEPTGNSLTIRDTFTAAGAGLNLTAIDVGDLDGDGNLDIVVGRGGNSNSVLWAEVSGGTSISSVGSPFNLGGPIVDLKIASIPEPGTLLCAWIAGMLFANLRRR